MTTPIQHHPHAYTALSSPSPLVWMPLDEVRQAWASFGAEALSCPALLATGNAFGALCWETSALQHYGMACQAQQRGGVFWKAAAPWLDRVVLDLGEALRDWRSVQLWLERLASGDTRQACTEPLEQVRALSEQTAAQQQRLHHLLGQVRQERSVYSSGGQATATVAPLAAASATVAAAGTREEEE